MAALSGLGQQQTSFAMGLGEMKLRKQMQDDMMRQMTIDNLLQYLRASYEKRHAEKRQKTMMQQQMVGKVASLGAAAVAGPLSEVFKQGQEATLGDALSPNGVASLFQPGGPGYSPVGMIGY